MDPDPKNPPPAAPVVENTPTGVPGSQPAAAAPTTKTVPTPEPIDLSSMQPGQKSFKKPAIIAAVVVILLLAVGAGAYFLRNSASNNPASAPLEPVAQTASATPTPSPLNLTVDNPGNNLLLTTNKVTVSGKTNPNTTVTIYNSSDETTVTADASGNYQGTVALDKGINTITVSALDDFDQEKTVNVNVVYDDGSS